MREAPEVTVNKVSLGSSTEAAELTSQAYSLLSKLYERGEKIKTSEFLVQIGVIGAGDWRKYPSGHRRVAARILNDVLVIQSLYGDRRDIHNVVEQKRVPESWRSEQRHWLTRVIDKVRQAIPTRQRTRTSREAVNDRFKALLKDDMLSYSFDEVVEFIGRYLEARMFSTEAIGDERTHQWQSAHGFFLMMEAAIEAAKLP